MSEQPPAPSTKPTRSRLRKSEPDSALNAKPQSTFNSSFLPHNLEPSSCYKDSFKEHNYKALRSITYMDPKLKPVLNQQGANNNGVSNNNNYGNSSADFDKIFQKQWIQYRMRKPPVEESGKHYDILTGRELGPPPPGAHGPGKRAGRVSIDKLNALKYGADRSGGDGKRSYNIISNAPLPTFPE
ncbi:hypothetical protein CcCBS67573_g05178 [Chytriomyces confervae]|uniref:Uncharacterized protein n=1 Tax=Chytriomyces confervae TaxID=246404 RepID=A0A507FE38_9FUNG|nr:hypothetical protein CcCBS67573_g05178 [Chytriomyces confervae]